MLRFLKNKQHHRLSDAAASRIAMVILRHQLKLADRLASLDRKLSGRQRKVVYLIMGFLFFSCLTWVTIPLFRNDPKATKAKWLRPHMDSTVKRTGYLNAAHLPIQR